MTSTALFIRVGGFYRNRDGWVVRVSGKAIYKDTRGAPITLFSVNSVDKRGRMSYNVNSSGVIFSGGLEEIVESIYDLVVEVPPPTPGFLARLLRRGN